MRRTVLSSLLLNRSNGFGSSWRICRNICEIPAQESTIRRPSYYTVQEGGLRHISMLPNPFLSSCFLINRSAKDHAYLHLRSPRTYATMRGSSSQAAANARKDPSMKSQSTLMYLLAVVVAMVGCSYAAVPLYRKFCQATGYGGTVRRRETVEEKIARHSKDDIATRQITVQFNADIADGLPWRFTPTQREVRVKPGQSTLAFFTAENLSSKPITGVSTYNVTPMKVAECAKWLYEAFDRKR